MTYEKGQLCPECCGWMPLKDTISTHQHNEECPLYLYQCRDCKLVKLGYVLYQVRMTEA